MCFLYATEIKYFNKRTAFMSQLMHKVSAITQQSHHMHNNNRISYIRRRCRVELLTTFFFFFPAPCFHGGVVPDDGYDNLI